MPVKRGDRVRDTKTGQTGTLLASQKSNWQDGVLCLVQIDEADWIPEGKHTRTPERTIVVWADWLEPAVADPTKPERRG